MRKTFGSHISGLFQSLPTIVAELNEEIAFVDNGHTVCHDRGSRVYLVMDSDDPVSDDTVTALVRNKLNQFRLREIKWASLRFPEIAKVPANIGERCWRGTKDEMESRLKSIKERRIVNKNSFAPDVEI